MAMNDVLYSATQNEVKASTSERAILTIKTKLSRYFTYKDDYTYLPILQDISDSYNTTYHRTIGMSPANVKTSNEDEVRLSTYFSHKHSGVKTENNKLKRFEYKKGDHVRITYLRNVFTRAYHQTYSGEIFKISNRYYRGDIPVYKLIDLQNEEIKGTFYQSELQKVSYDQDQFFKIDKILKTRGKGRQKEYFVNFRHYPAKFNAWTKANDLQ